MASAHTLTDHDQIRRWVESRGAHPACIKGTGRKGDTGMIRIDCPGFSGGKSLKPISWDDWFKGFDENNLVRRARTSSSGRKSSLARKSSPRRKNGSTPRSRKSR